MTKLFKKVNNVKNKNKITWNVVFSPFQLRNVSIFSVNNCHECSNCKNKKHFERTAINCRFYIGRFFFLHARSPNGLTKKNLKKTPVFELMTLIYYIKDNSFQLKVLDWQRKKGKWVNVTTTSSFVDGQTQSLYLTQKGFFLYMWRTLLLFIRPSFYTTLHCVARSIDVRTYYTHSFY